MNKTIRQYTYDVGASGIVCSLFRGMDSEVSDRELLRYLDKIVDNIELCSKGYKESPEDFEKGSFREDLLEPIIDIYRELRSTLIERNLSVRLADDIIAGLTSCFGSIKINNYVSVGGSD